MKKLIVAFLLVFSSSAQAQWWKRDNAHPEKYERMIAVDSLPAFWEYGQPKIYEKWWKEIAACENIALPAGYRGVRFFEVNGKAFVPSDFPWWLDAVTYPKISQIYIATPYVMLEEIVKHEMLHWIIWHDGFRLINQHPIEQFESCGIHRTGP